MTLMISVNAVWRSRNPRFSWLHYMARKLPCMQVRTGISTQSYGNFGLTAMVDMPVQRTESASLKLFEPITKSALVCARCATTKMLTEPVATRPVRVMACRLQEVRPRAPCTLPAQMTRTIRIDDLAALGLSGASFHEPSHARDTSCPFALLQCVTSLRAQYPYLRSVGLLANRRFSRESVAIHPHHAGAQRREESRGQDGRYGYAAAGCGAASLRNAAARPNVSPMV